MGIDISILSRYILAFKRIEEQPVEINKSYKQALTIILNCQSNESKKFTREKSQKILPNIKARFPMICDDKFPLVQIEQYNFALIGQCCQTVKWLRLGICIVRKFRLAYQ